MAPITSAVLLLVMMMAANSVKAVEDLFPVLRNSSGIANHIASPCMTIARNAYVTCNHTIHNYPKKNQAIIHKKVMKLIHSKLLNSSFPKKIIRNFNVDHSNGEVDNYLHKIKTHSKMMHSMSDILSEGKEKRNHLSKNNFHFSNAVAKQPINKPASSNRCNKTISTIKMQNIKRTKTKSGAHHIEKHQENSTKGSYVMRKTDILKSKRIFRRETHRSKFRNNALNIDNSVSLSGLKPSLNYNRIADIWQYLPKYLEASSVETKMLPTSLVNVPSTHVNDEMGATNTKIYPNDQKQHIDQDIEQVLDQDIEQVLDLLAQYISVEQAKGSHKINLTLLLDNIPLLKVHDSEISSRMMRDENIGSVNKFKDVGDKRNLEDIYSKTCRDFPVLKFLIKTLSGQDYDDYWPTRCLTSLEREPSYVKTITKKSTGVLPVNSANLSPMFTEIQSCRQQFDTTIIRLPGCVPKSLLITRCSGICSSRSVPEWNMEDQNIRHKDHCTCCSAFVIKFRALRFQCPRRPDGVLVLTIGIPFRCACRPCASLPEITAQQPYDY